MDLKKLANTLLVSMFILYLISVYIHTHYNVTWILWVKAMAEAGLAGAVADWFAVTALFRHPFNIKLPHTNILVNNKMKIAVDIDNTIVELKPSNEIFEAKAIKEMVEFVNKLYDLGHEIIIYTARGMTKLNGQAHLIPNEYFIKTKNQLDDIGIKYHSLVFGKLNYDLLIDDKAVNAKDMNSILNYLNQSG